MNIRVVNKSKFDLPQYQSALAAGLDLRANLIKEQYAGEFDLRVVMKPYTIEIKPLARVLIPTGLFIELPEGVEAQIRPRSGLAYKHGITVLNSPGTIDADYRGEIKVLLVNLSEEPFIVVHGERIAQMVVAKHEYVDWDPVLLLSDTKRGEGGFGSSGVK